MPFPLAAEFIQLAEQALGGALPASYKSAMQEHNGGELEANDDVWDRYPVSDTSDRKRLSRTANHIVKETQSLRSWTSFPPEALAVAGNGTGDQLVIIKADGVYGEAVYRWSHETGQLFKVADTFAELVTK